MENSSAKKYGSKCCSHITKMLTKLDEFVLVDDTDQLKTKKCDREIIEDIVDELQGSLDV